MKVQPIYKGYSLDLVEVVKCMSELCFTYIKDDLVLYYIFEL